MGGVYLIPPVVFNCIAWPSFIIWRRYSTKDNALRFERDYEEEQKRARGKSEEVGEEFINDLKNRINTMSKRCILLEGTAIYTVTLALAYYLFMWGNACGNGCASRWYHNQFELTDHF